MGLMCLRRARFLRLVFDTRLRSDGSYGTRGVPVGEEGYGGGMRERSACGGNALGVVFDARRSFGASCRFLKSARGAGGAKDTVGTRGVPSAGVCVYDGRDFRAWRSAQDCVLAGLTTRVACRWGGRGRRFALRRFLADLDAVRDAEEFLL